MITSHITTALRRLRFRRRGEDPTINSRRTQNKPNSTDRKTFTDPTTHAVGNCASMKTRKKNTLILSGLFHGHPLTPPSVRPSITPPHPPCGLIPAGCIFLSAHNNKMHDDRGSRSSGNGTRTGSTNTLQTSESSSERVDPCDRLFHMGELRSVQLSLRFVLFVLHLLKVIN